MNKNDDRILLLKKQIDANKKALSEKNTRFNPETNCILDFEGEKYNLNVEKEDSLKMLMLRLNMYDISARDLGLPIPVISKYRVDLWLHDIRSKLDIISLKRKESELKEMEAKLDKLLSEDKKTELEIDEIAALLAE